MTPHEFDLTQASRIYGVANTPLFLIRKLQVDPAVRALADGCSGEQILDALHPLLNTEPADPVEAVRPYALLVALWLKPEIDYLVEAQKLNSPVYAWYSYIVQVLIETFSPVTKTLIEVPGMLKSPAAVSTSTASTSRIIIA